MIHAFASATLAGAFGFGGEDGFAGLLGLTESPEAGESVRGGADNSEVLTTYTGTVPGPVHRITAGIPLTVYRPP